MMEKPQIVVHIQKPLNFTIFDVQWIPASAKFVVLGGLPAGSGTINILEISQGTLLEVKQITKPKAFKCGTFGASALESRHLATGDFDGKLQLWDLEDLKSPVFTVKGHSEIINAIDGVGGLAVGHGAAEVVTGSRDGLVKVWDMRIGQRPVAVMEPDGAKRDCWTVCFGHAFNASDRVVCSGYDNGDVKMFDLRRMQLRWETNVAAKRTAAGVCCLEFDRSDIEMNKLLLVGMHSTVNVYDLRTQHPTKGFACATAPADTKKGEESTTVWLGRHLPQNRDVLMTSGGGGSLSLWKYEYPTPQRNNTDIDGHQEGVAGRLHRLQSMVVSSLPCNAFAWNRDKQGLAVCSSFDQTVRVIIVTKLNTL